MSDPKRHHYLPQFYLRNFTRDGLLWVRDCQLKQQRQQSTKATAAINDYYTVEFDGKKDTSVEKLLSKVEGDAAPVIQALISRQQITNAQRSNLSLFISLQWNRVPEFQSNIEKMEGFLLNKMAEHMFATKERTEAAIKRYEDSTGKKLPANADEVHQAISSGDWEFKINREESIRMMLSTGTEFAKYFRQMTWIVTHCPPKSSFVTSDCPLILVPPSEFRNSIYSGCGLAVRGCQKFFPLSQSTCLVMLDRGDECEHMEIDQRTTRAININLAAHVYRFLIGRDEQLLVSLANFADKAAAMRDSRLTIG